MNGHSMVLHNYFRMPFFFITFLITCSIFTIDTVIGQVVDVQQPVFNYVGLPKTSPSPNGMPSTATGPIMSNILQYRKKHKVPTELQKLRDFQSTIGQMSLQSECESKCQTQLCSTIAGEYHSNRDLNSR